MSGIVTFALSLVPTKSVERVEKIAPPAIKPTISAERRSGLLSPTKPRPATVPLLCPRLGDSGPSRHVPGGGAAKDGREGGCRRRFSGRRESRGCLPGWGVVVGFGGTPLGGVSPRKTNDRTDSPCRTNDETDEEATMEPTKPTMSDQLSGGSWGLWTESFAPSLRAVGVLGGGPPKDLRAAHLRSNPVRKSLVRNVAAERPP